MDHERDRREEELRREAGRPPTAGRPTGGVRRRTEDDPLLDDRRGGLDESHQGVDDGRITRDEMRRAARDG
ncbi:MAG: hypothetical protein H0U55_12370, partial [Rubrobacteraceae bacterium]|nr:hypothetical protein [Rubrobacteraceae bacterium]